MEKYQYTYSSEVDKRIEVLKYEIDFDAMVDAAEDWLTEVEVLQTNQSEEIAPEVEELIQLLNFKKECVGYTSEWVDGTALVHEDGVKDYVQDMLKDTGELPRNLPSYIEIDWEATTKNILMDYSTVELHGECYYIRNT